MSKQQQQMTANIKAREAAKITATPAGQTYTVGQLLPIGSIRTDGGTQARAGLDLATVEEYTETWLTLSRKQNGFMEMPPIVVFHDGSSYWLADGFHRVAAYSAFLKSESASASPHAIRAVIQQGTRRDAVLFACGANDTHGLRRSRADKRRAIETLLRDDEWKEWSDSEIARRCQVDHKTVASVRAELYPGNSQDSRTVERGGTTYQMTPAAQPAQRKPTLSDEEQQHAKRIRGLLKGLSAWHESIQPDVIKDAYGHLHKIRGGALRDALKAEIENAEEAMQADVAPAAPDLAPLSEELTARAKRVGLNVWMSPDRNGYTTAQNPGAANYTDHASLDALTDFIASREAPTFWQAIDAHHPSAHLWTRTRPDLLRSACGLTMQNRLPSGATDASHCSSCVRATWVDADDPAADLKQRPNAPADWIWRDDNSLRCLADNVIIRPRMTHANTVAEAEQHDRIRAEMAAERDPAHIERLEERPESADTIPEASQQAVADQQLPIAAYVAAMDLIGKLRGAVVAGARADAIERCVQLKALLETAEE